MHRLLTAAGLGGVLALAVPTSASAATVQLVLLGADVSPVAVNARDDVLMAHTDVTVGPVIWRAGTTYGPFQPWNAGRYNHVVLNDIDDSGRAVGSADRRIGPTDLDGVTTAAAYTIASLLPQALPGFDVERTTVRAVATSADGRRVVGWGASSQADEIAIASGVDLPAGATRYIEGVNDRGDILGRRGDGASMLWPGAGGAIELPFDTLDGHPLAEDGSVVGQRVPPGGSFYEAALRKPDGTVVSLAPMERPAAVQAGVVVGTSDSRAPHLAPLPLVWRNGRTTDLTPYFAKASWAVGRHIVPKDVSTNGTIVGEASAATQVTYAWMLRMRVVISGTVSAPPLPGAALAPSRGRVVLTPITGGAATTVAPDASGRWRAEVAPGGYRVALQGVPGCVVGARPCRATTTVDAQDDVALAFRVDATSRLAAPSVRPRARLAARDGKVAVRVACRLVTRACTGAATIVRRGATLARLASLRVPAGATARVRLSVTAAGRRALAASRAPVGASLVIGIRSGARTVKTTVAVRLDG